MPNIPLNTPLGYIGFGLLIVGVFLILTGFDIVKIEKVTVKPGKPTWMIGILATILGVVLFAYSEPISTEVVGITSTPTELSSIPNTGVTSTTYPLRAEGTWTSDSWGEVKLKQTGNQVTGQYTYSDEQGVQNGHIEGEMIGNTANFLWWEGQDPNLTYEETYSGRKGDGYFVLSTDGQKMEGKWRKSNETADNWSGNWVLERIGQ